MVAERRFWMLGLVIAVIAAGILYGLKAGSTQDVVAATDVDVIEFEDPLLEQAVRDQIGVTDAPLTSEDLSKVTVLNIAGLGVTSLEGIQHLKELRALHAANNEITDLMPLQPLMDYAVIDRPKLGYLDLSFNAIPRQDIYDIDWIQYAKLHLDGNPILDSECDMWDIYEVCFHSLPQVWGLSQSTAIEVTKNGDIIFREPLEDNAPGEFATNPPLQDLTGDGFPNFAIFRYGERRNAIEIFEIEPQVRMSDRFVVVDAWFEDIDGDGVPELLQWPGYAMGIPLVWYFGVPHVLTFSGEGYVPLLTPAPDARELERLAAELMTDEWESWTASIGSYEEPGWDARDYELPVGLTKAMAGLILGGNWAEAFALADTVWPESKSESKDLVLYEWFGLARSFSEFIPQPPTEFEELWRTQRGLPPVHGEH